MPDPITCMEAAGHPVDGVLHIGERKREPLPDYRSSGASPCIYVNPSEEICNRLSSNFASDPWHIVVRAICASQKNNYSTYSNWARETGTENTGENLPAKICTLDGLVAEHSARRPPNLLVIDASGSELGILRSGTQTLSAVDGVYVLFDEPPRNSSIPIFIEIQIFLMPFGLIPVWLDLDRIGVGQAFFSRPAPEVEILPTFGGNVALGKWAAQSSLSQWSHPTIVEEAGRALNGQITGDCSFHTDIEDNPWWFVDLGKIQNVNEIRIYNRPGPYRVRARTLKIVISVDAKNWIEVHDQAGYSFGGISKIPLRVTLNKCDARYIALRLFERTCLHLDEIEVY